MLLLLFYYLENTTATDLQFVGRNTKSLTAVHTRKKSKLCLVIQSEAKNPYTKAI